MGVEVIAIKNRCLLGKSIYTGVSNRALNSFIGILVRESIRIDSPQKAPICFGAP
jgi:hypothetical protein